MKIALLSVLGWIACLFLSTLPLHAAELPQIQMVNGTGQLIVNGHSFLILGGELGNSSSTTAAQADAILPKLATDDGAMLILQSSPGEFYIAGSGLTVSFVRDPDIDSNTAGIESVEEVSRTSGQWKTERPLHGDQTNQGRQLLMDAKRPHIYRVRLYSISSEREH